MSGDLPQNVHRKRRHRPSTSDRYAASRGDAGARSRARGRRVRVVPTGRDCLEGRERVGCSQQIDSRRNAARHPPDADLAKPDSQVQSSASRSSFAWWASGRLLALGRYRGLFARSAQRRCRYAKTPSGRVLISASAHRSPVSRVHAGRGGATLSRVLGLVGWLAVVGRSPSGYERYRADDRSSAGG